MDKILRFLVETFDLQSNDTFRKVVGTVITILALGYPVVQIVGGLIGVELPALGCEC